MDDKIGALIEAQARFEEIQPYLPVIDDALPMTPDAIPLLIQFRNLAEISGAHIASIQLSSVPLIAPGATLSAQKSSEPQQTYDFSISVQGPYQALNAFIEGLKQHRRIISFETLSVEPIQIAQVGTESAQLTSRQLQLTIKVIAYYMTKP